MGPQEDKEVIGRSDPGSPTPIFHAAVFSCQILLFLISRVESLAKDKGVSMAQLSVAWLLHKHGM